MKPNDKLVKLLNYRINQEEYSSRLYHAMSIWLDNNGYLGAAKTWKAYSNEELTHAGKVYEFLLSFGIMPEIQTIQSVDTDFKGLSEIIKASYDHEYEISRQCEELATTGQTEKNLMVFDLGMWLVREQIEELDRQQTLMDKLKAFGTDPVSLRLFDKELGE